MANSRLIVVLGMHRSGTSAVTRALQVMNVELGDKLMPAADGDNPKGFFEDTDIYALNVEMLQTLHIDWYSLAPIEDHDVANLRKMGYFIRAVELLKSKCAEKPVWAFKDPRIAKILPFWKAVFDHCQFAVSYVVTVRHPRSVAKSLAKRNGFDLEKGYLLWLEHLTTIISFTQEHSCAYVDYDQLVESPAIQVRRLAKALGLKINSAEFDRYKSEFLDSSLRHSIYTVNDLGSDNSCPPLVQEIYVALLEVANQSTMGSLEKPKVARWVAEFARLNSMLSYLDRVYSQNASRVQELGKLTQQVTSLNAETMARGQWGLDLDKVIAERDSQIVELNRTLADKAAEQGLAVARERVDLQRQIETAKLSLERAEQELVQHTKDHSQRERELNARLIEFQDEMRSSELTWVAKSAEHDRSAADERALLQRQIEAATQALQRAEQERLEQESKHSQRERELNSRAVDLQSDLRRTEQGWATKATDREVSVSHERTLLLGQIEVGRQLLNGVEQEKNRLAADHSQRELSARLIDLQTEMRKSDQTWAAQLSERDLQIAEERSLLLGQIEAHRVALQSAEDDRQKQASLHSQREGELSASLFALRTELHELDKDWNSKILAREISHAGEQTALQREAELTNQLARRWEMANEKLLDQFTAVHASTYWRLTAPLRWVSQWCSPTTAAIFSKPNQPVDLPIVSNAPMTPFRSIQTQILVRPPCSLEELMELHDEQFIHAAYFAVLRREPDTAGRVYYLNRLRKGVSKLEILNQLLQSKEGHAQRVNLTGFDEAIRQFRKDKPSALGAIFARRRILEAQRLNALENQLQRTIDQSRVRLDQIGSAMADLQASTVERAQVQMAAIAIKEYGNAELDTWRTAETLIRLDGPDFIERLFGIALGRSAQKYESDHYVHLLGLNVSKLHLITLLFTSEECRSRMDQTPAAVPIKVFPEGITTASSGIADLIYFPKYDSPTVSIVIPVYGKINYTLACLQAIQKNLPKVAFEIIVVDDQSPDNTLVELYKIASIRIIANAENRGFIHSCNTGASAARGNFICFLNNDTEVMVGWLDELVRTFYEFPGTGFAGSKLIYPDGTLQEAGGIIWRDGSAWNFGRNQDASLPVYNYAREVDYCSGASIMVPAALFKELNGFDLHYEPAYCEDSDLALRIRSKGLRVIYQPMSVVVHHEGISSGTDITKGPKAYQIENSKKLFARWQPHLVKHQVSGLDVDAAKDRSATRRALLIDHCTPTPDQDAGSVTVLNLMLLLREMGFQVTFIPEDNFLYMPNYTTALQRAGIEVVYAPYVTSVEQHLVESRDRYSLAFLFRPTVAERHLKDIRRLLPKAKILYHTVDLHFLRMSREAVLLQGAERQIALTKAAEMKRLELYAIRAADACIVHSTAEHELLCQDLPQANIHVFPLIMELEASQIPFARRKDIVFIGGYQHTPNVDAVLYFVGEIMPLIRRSLPGVCFYAVGSKPPSEIQALACEDVIISGYVDDLGVLLDTMRVSVAPLRFGAGVKGKIGTAMAVGLPVVTTPLGAEGMSLTADENIVVADGAQHFCDAVTKLYLNEILWTRVSKNGLTFASHQWGAEAAWNTLGGILSTIDLHVFMSSRPLTLYKLKSVWSRNYADLAPITSAVADAVQQSDYDNKIEQELAIFSKQENVHDLPAIFHYWSNRFLLPILKDAGHDSIKSFFAVALFESANQSSSQRPNFLSIGAGNCELEVSIAQTLVEMGCKDFNFECVELNPIMLERAASLAESSGVRHLMQFTLADFNTWRPKNTYSGVMANQSLHHVSDLEHLFEQIQQTLLPACSFVVIDMMGRNGHQRWPESLAVIQRFWMELSDRYKFNLLLNRQEASYENWDCSKEGFEGIRSQDVLPNLLRSFVCHQFIGFGSAIDVFVDRCFGHHFDPDNEIDRAFIDRVHQADEDGLQAGTLTPTHMMAVFKMVPCASPMVSRGITPERSVRVE
jgi:GT2 family glycosyltransferase/glycosyltransferase involved in cell wall biosynthesis/SAM-dependent methyltransferase